MNITMQNLERLSLAEMKEFVEGSRKVCFSTEAREETYGCIEGTLNRQQYRKLSKGQKGIVRRFVVKVTGLSRAQMTRLVGCWTNQRCIPTKAVMKRRRFARRYTAEDIRLLASVDAAHEDLSGPGVRRILQREFTVFGKPGVFHINAVDTVTQWQGVGCVETISENHLVAVLESMLHQFPFRILRLHSNTGSEFINQKVAEMLKKLLEEFTKSRAYRTTDNALVEGKNGAVVRKHIGSGPIGSEHAGAWHRF